MTNSKQKGSRAEREASKYLIDLGFPSAHRGQQFSGGDDSPDVVCDELQHLNIEVKWDEGFTVQSELLACAMRQSIRDAGATQIAVVIWKRKRGPWMLTFMMDGYMTTVVKDKPIRHHLMRLDSIGSLLSLAPKTEPLHRIGPPES